MRKQLYSTLLCTFFIALNVSGQHTISEDLMKKMQKIYDYAQEGYQKRTTEPLLKAAEILLYNPEIRPFSEKNVKDSTTLENEEEHFYYFNPRQLLSDAKKYRPVDARMLKWRIRFLEKRLKRWEKWQMMNPNGSDKANSDIQVKNYLIYSKNSKTIDSEFKKDQTITLSVRVGNDLRLTVWNTKTNTKVGKSEFIGDARLISFETESGGVYQIKIENVSAEANDCLLMIETR